MTAPTNTDPSPHFADFQPEADTPIRGYGSVMTGAGRWFLMRNDTVVFGVLWTDDKYAVGLLSIEESDPGAVAAVFATLDQNYANGVPATAVFDELLTDYPTDTQGEGNLADLLDLF